MNLRISLVATIAITVAGCHHAVAQEKVRTRSFLAPTHNHISAAPTPAPFNPSPPNPYRDVVTHNDLNRVERDMDRRIDAITAPNANPNPVEDAPKRMFIQPFSDLTAKINQLQTAITTAQAARNDLTVAKEALQGDPNSNWKALAYVILGIAGTAVGGGLGGMLHSIRSKLFQLDRRRENVEDSHKAAIVATSQALKAQISGTGDPVSAPTAPTNGTI